MAIDPQFHPVFGTLSQAELIALCDVILYHDGKNGDITHAATPDTASKGALVLIGHQDYLESCSQSGDFTIITNEALAKQCPQQCTILVAQNPRLAFAQALQMLYQATTNPAIAPSASIAATAKLGDNVSIGEGAVIEDGVIIGDNTVIGHHCIIGKNCQLGANIVILEHTSIHFSKISDHAKIGAQCAIGKEGFGFEMTDEGAVRLPHLGLVEIGCSAEIGAHCAIDRGVLGNTVINDYVMIDNHVHIAHNVQIGQRSLILAQVGIAGSSVIGQNVIIGGQVGIKDHINIVDNVMVMSGSKVTKSLEKAGAYAGFPAQEAKQHWREMAAMKKLLKKARD